MTISRDFHDRCLLARKMFKLAEPALTEKAEARGVPLKIGSPEHGLMKDLQTLDAVAASFATGIEPSRRQMDRARYLVETITGVAAR